MDSFNVMYTFLKKINNLHLCIWKKTFAKSNFSNLQWPFDCHFVLENFKIVRIEEKWEKLYILFKNYLAKRLFKNHLAKFIIVTLSYCV